ncbi:PspC domain-containing protein [Rhizorhabdus dicambivorans]|uniref:PspC domain-containing protein n=1 Tax=Rhizorhabdus dicambivorans TaxID=1850238 RepID=A0A2A4FWV6_9SPHN|nr:PspC domain-containing protein [Rhizorhabdus dicambivorans]ATE65585.1 PspC domain-containing protein [Rhizorhabdus dicambivorans]PCE41928.1 PspC domain-containing protein [Rhizorhabdus dicambivorans]
MTSNNTFWRHDTFFGVCEAIGQDFGFNANWLRILFATALLFSPKIVLIAYFGLGAVVLASRLIFPKREARPAAIEARGADNDAEMAELPLAA